MRPNRFLGLMIAATVVLCWDNTKSVMAADVLEAPQLKNGDWWKVTVEIDQGTMSRSTCFERYDEYLVKISGGKPKVFVNNGDEEISCPEISNRLLGLGKGVLGIHFPLEFNKPKTTETDSQPFGTVTVTWVGIEKYPLGPRVLEVYKLARRSTFTNNADVYTESLLYSKECKCNVVFDRARETKRNKINQKQVLKDFGS